MIENAVVRIDKVAEFADQKYPAYVVEDYQIFSQFLTDFFKWLEQDQYPRDLIRNSRAYLDIDATTDLLLDHFLSQFANDLPQSITANRVLLVKHVKDLYANKGNEIGLKLFFRIVQGEDVSVYYPANDILRVSDGKWTSKKTIIIKLNGAHTLSVGDTLIGQTSNATASIINTTKIIISIGTYYICDILLSGALFIENELITSNNVTIGKLEPIVTGLTIVDPGTGYQIGDLISVGSVKFRVTSVDFLGGILEITQIAAGLYVPFDANSIKSLGQFLFGAEPVGAAFLQPLTITTSQGLGATFIIQFGSVNTSGGYYRNQDGIISGKPKIQDSYYYQAYSYDISTVSDRTNWETSFKNIMHAAGNILFTTYPTTNTTALPIKSANEAIVVIS
jgi:hypothetical protein